MAAVPNFAAVLELDHKEMDEKPSPVPSESRISEIAAVTKPPAITADQETPEECASFRSGTVPEPCGLEPMSGIVIFYSIIKAYAARWAVDHSTTLRLIS